MEIIEVFKQFTEWQNSGYSKSEVPNTEALCIVMNLLQRQIATSPNIQSYKPLLNAGWEYGCPNCGCAVGINKNSLDYTEESDYCSECGQKLNW